MSDGAIRRHPARAFLMAIVSGVIDLWRLIIPRHNHVWHDKVEDRLHHDASGDVVPGH